MAGAKPGERRGGRQKGTPNKSTLSAIAKLEELKCDPLEILARIAKGETMQAGVKLPDGTYSVEGQTPTIDHIFSSAKELANYVYPKRKAIEGGDPERPLRVQIGWDSD